MLIKKTHWKIKFVRYLFCWDVCCECFAFHIQPKLNKILDGDDDFRFRDIADTAYDMNYVICQTGKCTSHCIFICHNFYLPEIKYKSPCILI